MSDKPIATAAGVFVALSLSLTTPVLADAIDGNWCSPDGRKMAIDGPTIDTPGGNRITGNYDRHGFSYVVPNNEPQPGSTITMDLVDEDTIHLRRGTIADAGTVEVWKRCELTT